MNRLWRIRPHDATLIAHIERSAKVSSVIAQLLAARDIRDADTATAFLDPKLSVLRDPELLPGLSLTADRLKVAIDQKRRIVVYGDYDADGMTATALMVRCLRLLGAHVSYYLPNRMEEGYGLNSDAIERLAETGAETILSVDCGIGSVEEARTAQRCGVELLITDHHQPGLELPPAAAIAHPQLPGSSYPFPHICGAAIAFKLAWAVCQRASAAKRVSQPLRDFLLSALALAAIGTVADVMPLIDENRAIVKHGLVSLKQRPPVGLTQMLRVAGLDQKSSLSSEDIGFTIGPRLNAAGRLGQAQLGVELLATEDTERAKALASYLEELNGNRLHLERSIYLAASRQAKERFDPASDAALVLAERGWHQGVIGIVAGRLAEKYHRPVVMIALDELGGRPGTGSARGIPGLDLNQALGACREHLLRHGGHAAAAGLRIDEAQVDQFRHHFCQHVEEQLQGAPLAQELSLDAETSLSELNLNVLRDIERLAPFGHGNPRPLLCATSVSIAEGPRAIGQGERHLSVTFEQYGAKLRGVAFNRAEWIEDLQRAARPLDIAFRPVINEFRGRQTVEMHLVDWRPTGDR